MTTALPTGSGTFLTGSASGRVLSFSDTCEASPIGGNGHSSLVTSLSSGKHGKVFSAGFDDHLREIDGSTFTFVRHQTTASHSLTFSRPASLSTKSQPRSIAVGGDGSVFLAEINGLEVVRDNQKSFELSTSFTPSAIDAHGSLVAVGGEVVFLTFYVPS